jgi:hypothetical protein
MVGYDDASVKCLVRLDYQKADEDLAQLSAIGATNPFIAGWELLPWSFVVDYMSNVGDVIASWGATLGWDFLSGSCSITERLKRTGRAQLREDFSGYCGDSVNGISLRFNRSIYLQSPLPGFHFQDPVSYGHAANLIALATSKLIDKSFK